MARHEQIIGICDISVVSQQFSVKLKVSESGYVRSACGGLIAMTIQLKLNSETEARLIAEARAKGVPLEHVAEQLLEEALAGRPSSRCKMSVAEFHEMLDCMAEGSER